MAGGVRREPGPGTEVVVSPQHPPRPDVSCEDVMYGDVFFCVCFNSNIVYFGTNDYTGSDSLHIIMLP